jgi:hypothetical protein
MSKQDLLMISLTQFFKDKNNLDKMLKIIYSKSIISLRILDWFVTNYSKKNNTSYLITENNKNVIKFIVYLDYKSQLKAYSKHVFDPFCRRTRISFYDQNNNEIETTVGQLNFFRWAINNGILDYVEKNIKTIENDMNNSIKNIYKKSPNSNEPKIRRKRQQLSISATKTVNKHDINIIVQFE